MALYNFPPSSRYFGVETASLTAPGGEQTAYLRRRFVPHPEQFSVLHYYTIKQGDRLDNVTASVMGDALAFWRLADANRATRPEALTETPGRSLRVTLPQGIPGITNA
jgi:hypothetical protein